MTKYEIQDGFKPTIKGEEDNNMAVYKRLTITIHPIELDKLDIMTEANNETRSGMIQRLIKDYIL